MINSLTQHWGSEGSRREQPEKNQFSSLAFLLWLESGFSSDSLSHPSTAGHHFPCLTSSSSYLLIGLQKKSKLKMQNKWQRAGFVNIWRLLSESKKSFISFDINLMCFYLLAVRLSCTLHVGLLWRALWMFTKEWISVLFFYRTSTIQLLSNSTAFTLQAPVEKLTPSQLQHTGLFLPPPYTVHA